MTKETATFEQPVTDTIHYHSDVYNPDHPDADWSGFVSRRSCRRHNENQPAQIAAVCDGTNFGPVDGVQTADWSKPARRIVPYRESGTVSRNDGSQSCEINGLGPTKSSTFSLIGGPIPVNSPSSFSPTCWETETQAAARKRKTELQQLTNKGRSIHVRGRKRRSTIDAGDSDAQQLDSCLNKLRTYPDSSSCHEGNIHNSNDPTDLIGFRANFTSFTDQNFLREIGDAVGASLSSVTIPCSTAPFATDDNLPTDPYRSESGERRKDLLLENFSSVVPGYTGKRTFGL